MAGLKMMNAATAITYLYGLHITTGLTNPINETFTSSNGSITLPTNITNVSSAVWHLPQETYGHNSTLAVILDDLDLISRNQSVIKANLMLQDFPATTLLDGTCVIFNMCNITFDFDYNTSFYGCLSPLRHVASPAEFTIKLEILDENANISLTYEYILNENVAPGGPGKPEEPQNPDCGDSNLGLAIAFIVIAVLEGVAIGLLILRFRHYKEMVSEIIKPPGVNKEYKEQKINDFYEPTDVGKPSDSNYSNDVVENTLYGLPTE